jgi:hypothetical protein
MLTNICIIIFIWSHLRASQIFRIDSHHPFHRIAALSNALQCTQIRGSAESASASCDFFCQIFSEALPSSSSLSSTSPSSYVIEFQRRAGDGFVFRAAFERISARLVASLAADASSTVRPYLGNA